MCLYLSCDLLCCVALVEVEGAQAFRDSLELNNQPEGVPDNQPEGGQDMSFRDTIERWRRSAAGTVLPPKINQTAFL